MLTCTHVHDAKDDPTGTLPLQRRWSRDMEQRWSHVKRMMPAMLAEHTNPLNLVSHSVLTGKGDPVHHFNIWLDEALRQLVMGTNGNWMMTYVRQAADAGLKFAGDPSGATDRTHILQSLVVTELQGIMDAVSQQATRIFATGVMQRRPLARMRLDINAIVDAVGVRRSRLLVSFFTVKAFNAAALDGYRARGFTKVGIRPEKRALIKKLAKDAHPYEGMIAVQTAEDDDVCPECEEIAADGPYYIDEAEALIPAHPNCRCALVPADEEENEDFAEDAGNEDEPRDDHGRWTSGGGGDKLQIEREMNPRVITGPRDENDKVIGAQDFPMLDPTEHGYRLKMGNVEGEMIVEQQGEHLHIRYIGAGPRGEGISGHVAGALGHREIRQIGAFLKRTYPGTKTIGGYRMSGTREQHPRETKIHLDQEILDQLHDQFVKMSQDSGPEDEPRDDHGRWTSGAAFASSVGITGAQIHENATAGPLVAYRKPIEHAEAVKELVRHGFVKESKNSRKSDRAKMGKSTAYHPGSKRTETTLTHPHGHTAQVITRKDNSALATPDTLFNVTIKRHGE